MLQNQFQQKIDFLYVNFARVATERWGCWKASILSVQGPPIHTDWMIWNTADPITTNTNRAWKKNTKTVVQNGTLKSTMKNFTTSNFLTSKTTFKRKCAKRAQNLDSIHTGLFQTSTYFSCKSRFRKRQKHNLQW